MHRRIAILLIASALVVKVYSNKDVLKCYSCTSLSDKSCASSSTIHQLEPMECTFANMVEWQNVMKQHTVLKSITPIFEIAESMQHNYAVPMACAKMIFNVNNQDVIVRACQMAETEVVFPCQSMNKSLHNHNMIKMEQCALCRTEACNGTTFPSPKIFHIFLAFFGILIYVAFYQ